MNRYAFRVVLAAGCRAPSHRLPGPMDVVIAIGFVLLFTLIVVAVLVTLAFLAAFMVCSGIPSAVAGIDRLAGARRGPRIAVARHELSPAGTPVGRGDEAVEA